MYQVIFMLKFRKDITPEYARSEWRGRHGAIALTLPGLRRYVQYHWSAPATGHEQVYDGSLILGFDDEAAFNTAFTSPVGNEMMKDDLRLFDRSTVPAYVGGVVEEHVMHDESTGKENELYQVIFMLKFRKDITPGYARSEWLGSHGAIALGLPGLRRYVQYHWKAAATGHEQVYDGSLILGFDNEEAFAKSFTSAVGKEMLKDDLRLFDRSMTPAYIGGVVEEHVMPDPTVKADAEEVYA